MSVEYLGKVNRICTGKELETLTGITAGTLLVDIDITWLKFMTNEGKLLLVASECVKRDIHWEYLNNRDCIQGKYITLSNIDYNCRVLTGGNSNPSSGPGGEWDSLIVSFVPNDKDSNWSGLHTICQEETSTSGYIVARGNGSLNEYYKMAKGTTGGARGWRPVLESVYNFPVFSIASENLGNILNFENKTYTVTDLDVGDSFTIVEKLDNTIIRTLENQTSETQYTLDLSNRWDSISYGKHTIEIIATDTNRLSSTVTITFNKIKSPVTTLPTTASLKQSVAHNKEIKKEIDYQCIRLEETLKEKGVEVEENDKTLASLIGNVGTIEKSVVFKEGKDNVIDLSLDSTFSDGNVTFKKAYLKGGLDYIMLCYNSLNRGRCIVSFSMSGAYQEWNYAYVYVLSNNKEIKFKSERFSQYSTTATECEQVVDVEVGDYILICDANRSNPAGNFSSFKIYYNE